MQALLPVLVGLAAGIALIVAFAIMIDAYSAKHTKEDYLSRFQKFGPSETLSLQKLEGPDESDTVVRAENAMKSCTPAYIVIGYGLGGMQIAIEGASNESCVMAIMYDIEMGGKSLDCSVPLDKMAQWKSWKNANMPSVSEISEYCREVHV